MGHEMKSKLRVLTALTFVVGTLLGCQKEKFSPAPPPPPPAPVTPASVTPTNGSNGTFNPTAGGPTGFPGGQPTAGPAFPPNGVFNPGAMPWPVSGPPSDQYYNMGTWDFSEEFFVFVELYFLVKPITYIGSSDVFTAESGRYEKLMIRALRRLGFRHFVFENDTPDLDNLNSLDQQKWSAVQDELNDLEDLACPGRNDSDDSAKKCLAEDLRPDLFQLAQQTLSQSAPMVGAPVEAQASVPRVAFIGHNRSQSSVLRQSRRDVMASIWMINGSGHDSSPLCDKAECRVTKPKADIADLLGFIGHRFLIHTQYLVNTIQNGLNLQNLALRSELGIENLDIATNTDYIFYVDRVESILEP